MPLDKVREVELTALRNEMREWQARRFQLATIAGAFAGAMLAFLSRSQEPKAGDLAPARLIGLWVLILLLALTSYCSFANGMGAAYIQHYFKEFRWENDELRKNLKVFPRLQHLLCGYCLVLSFGFYVAGCTIDGSSAIKDWQEQRWLVIVTGVLLGTLAIWAGSQGSRNWGNDVQAAAAQLRGGADAEAPAATARGWWYRPVVALLALLGAVAWVVVVVLATSHMKKPSPTGSTDELNKIKQTLSSLDAAQTALAQVGKSQAHKLEQVQTSQSAAQRDLSQATRSIRAQQTQLQDVAKRLRSLEKPK